MFSACPVRHAATVTSRSSRCGPPPEIEVKESRNSGHQPTTSKIASEISTRGIIASTRLRRSISDGGSSIAVTLATCTFPAVSMRTAVLAGSRPATAR